VEQNRKREKKSTFCEPCFFTILCVFSTHWQKYMYMYGKIHQKELRTIGTIRGFLPFSTQCYFNLNYYFFMSKIFIYFTCNIRYISRSGQFVNSQSFWKRIESLIKK
jgi:hypothetical protein